MSLYEDLVVWSREIPDWQRDALRRLATGGEPSVEDIEELAELAAAREEQRGDRRPIPLGEEHLPLAGDAVQSVQLLAIEIGDNVNAIAPNSRLEFAPTGVTVIYGDNASGKSGYVRVLKRMCRTRGRPEQVLPNVLRSDDRPPSAIVEFRVGESIERRGWSPGSQAPSDLSAVTVFDRSCAAVYVNAENEVAYSPLGLDLFDRLVAVLRLVKKRLEHLRADNISGRLVPPADLLESRILKSVWPPSHRSSASDLEKKADWGSDNERQADQLAAALSVASPVEITRGLRARQTALARAIDACNIADEAVAAARRAPLVRARADDVAAAIRQLHVEEDPHASLPGVGGELWRAMWAAAERFSTEAYPDEAFPNTKDGARCVLCAQSLTAAARERFDRLRTLVSSELEDDLRRARQDLADLTARVLAITNVAHPHSLVAELEGSDPEAFAVVVAFLTQVHAALQAELVADLDPTVVSPAGWLQGRLAQLQQSVVALDRATDANERTAMTAELAELRGRRWVHENAANIVDEGARQSRLRAIELGIQSCDSGSITHTASELTVKYVTGGLRRDFELEVQALNPTRIPVRIVKRGSYGTTYHRLQVATASTVSAGIGEIVSDGEFRGLALANLLAETRSTSSCSAIVLDDPVTSLDHRFRARVATRLVSQASTRQVVVFTHDLVFVQDLTQAAEVADVPISFSRLGVTRTHVGMPFAEPPWDGMKLKQRVEALQLELNALRQAHDDGDMEGYERGVPRWYSRLRSTWERGVEEVLFVDAVNRFRSQIKTNNLVSEKVWHLEERDVRDVESAMTKASSWTDAHDEPAAANRLSPNPDDLRLDLQALRDWMARLRDQRR